MPRELLAMAKAVVDLGSRRRTLLFLRADHLAHFVSCLVYLPRDRYTTAVRLEMQDILVRELGGVSIEYTARVSESPWAVVHFTVRLREGSRPSDVDVSLDNETRIQNLLTEAARTWGDRLIGSVKSGSIDHAAAEHYATAFPEVYKQAFTPNEAIADIAIIEELQDNSVKLVFAEGDGDETPKLTWYLAGRSASLSELLPMLQSMGVEVLEERPFSVTRADGVPVWIYQFKIALHQSIPDAKDAAERDANATRFADAVTAIWQGRVEIDRFNELVLRAGLTWQQVTVLRSYAKYLRQAGFPYSQAHIESVVNHNPHTARSLVELFEALFESSDSNTRPDAQAAAVAVATDIDALTSLDTDRVLRAFASMIQATLRTNYFVTRAGSVREQNVLSFKVNPSLIDELPLPRPRYEIFVYSPRVEGVHLRFGNVARGGLRWSDRREDFRTEILGLVKAQAVKNAVIVPVGAKGGFVLVTFGSPIREALGWVWPPTLLLLVIWMLHQTSRHMRSRSGRVQLYLVFTILAFSAVGGTYATVLDAKIDRHASDRQVDRRRRPQALPQLCRLRKSDRRPRTRRRGDVLTTGLDRTSRGSRVPASACTTVQVVAGARPPTAPRTARR